ncbi:MAG: hypothetical protein HRU14_17135 [Planctomycetes bacterium]|nr:hypothetical protein [Planctomycetota bacterium]
MKSLLLLFPLLLCSCVSAGDAEPITAPEPAASKPTRVLFVGNSFTFWRGGLWKHLKALSDAMEPALGYEAESVVRGGASLEVMWKRTRAVEVIAEGRWDVVVLQEDLPETSVAAFREYGPRFVKAVRDTGARPILFMTWEYDRLDWISMQEIADAHREMAAALKIEVAPVGLAWSRARAERPDLNMYARDREHPSVAGMYLSLMVIEATISGADPRSRNPAELSIRGLERLEPKDLEFLRDVAYKTIKEWSGARQGPR